MPQSKILQNDRIDKMWDMLREDASHRGMSDLELVYGWSQIRRRLEILEKLENPDNW